MSKYIPGNQKHLSLNDRKFSQKALDEGQSPYQIAVNHPELNMSVRSIYTYIDKGFFTSRNIDLKRKPQVQAPQMPQGPDHRPGSLYRQNI